MSVFWTGVQADGLVPVPKLEKYICDVHTMFRTQGPQSEPYNTGTGMKKKQRYSQESINEKQSILTSYKKNWQLQLKKPSTNWDMEYREVWASEAMQGYFDIG